MSKVLNFQLSLFGSFRNIQPDIDLTMKINESLKDEGFVPGTAQVNNLDIVANKMIQETRLQMVSSDNTWTIVFLADRVDINYAHAEDSIEYYISVDEVFNRAKILCEKAFTVISATVGVRLAVNGRFLLAGRDEDKTQEYIKRFAIPPQIYTDKPLSEWNVRFNSPMSFRVFDKSVDNCNFIINIGNATLIELKTGQKTVRNETVIDINTPAENTEAKYTYQHLLSFSQNAVLLMQKALDEIEGE